MQNYVCAIDFGTSNSTSGVCASNWQTLIAIDEGHQTMPSALFFPTARPGINYGRAAIRDYLDEEPGRLMRSLKSLLGTRTFHDRTYVQGKSTAFLDILAMFIRRLRFLATSSVEAEIDSVVLGRPVFFIERDGKLDCQAEDDLRQAALLAGFKHVEFQYEPIAAALEYERDVGGEELVLIADIGGGTSDFSIVRVSPDRARAVDRKQDVLANTGIRIGGTDFDRLLALRIAMPLLGLNSTYSAKKLDVPRGLYHDLATWSRVNFVYEEKVRRDIRAMTREAQSPQLLGRLSRLVEKHHGHRLIGAVEGVKVDLSQQEEACLNMEFLEDGLQVPTTRGEFETVLGHAMNRIGTAIDEAVTVAGVVHADIETVFLTGGSALVPIVQNTVMRHFPAAKLRTGDMLGSVGKGLMLEADRRFLRPSANA